MVLSVCEIIILFSPLSSYFVIYLYIIKIYDGVAYKVFPEQIEAQLSKHPGVTGVCIVGDTDGNDWVLHAFVIPEKDAAADLEQFLKDYCTGNMSLYTRPKFYTFVDTFPRSPAGKVDYRALEEQVLRNK